MLVHELIQPYLDNKANPNFGISITKGQLPSIPPVRLSQESFPLSIYPVHKSCVAFAYEKSSAGKYKKTKT